MDAREFWDIINRDDQPFINLSNPPTITFSQDIKEYATGLEHGMMATLTGVGEKKDMIHFVCDLSKYEDRNKTFELPVFEGEDGKFVKWSESFFYPENKIIEFFVDAKNELPFEVGETNKLYEEYIESKSEGSYVKWLETELLKVRSAK